jgi:hypothetical protein
MEWYKLFPQIQEIINTEIHEENLDFDKITFLNHVSKIVWYDYEIKNLVVNHVHIFFNIFFEKWYVVKIEIRV